MVSLSIRVQNKGESKVHGPVWPEARHGGTPSCGIYADKYIPASHAVFGADDTPFTEPSVQEKISEPWCNAFEWWVTQQLHFKQCTVCIGYRVTGFHDLPGVIIGLTKIISKSSKRHTKYHYSLCNFTLFGCCKMTCKSYLVHVSDFLCPRLKLGVNYHIKVSAIKTAKKAGKAANEWTCIKVEDKECNWYIR